MMLHQSINYDDWMGLNKVIWLNLDIDCCYELTEAAAPIY